jgi:hypothetical protein
MGGPAAGWMSATETSTRCSSTSGGLLASPAKKPGSVLASEPIEQVGRHKCPGYPSPSGALVLLPVRSLDAGFDQRRAAAP